jgi:hypothetical protein
MYIRQPLIRLLSHFFLGPLMRFQAQWGKPGVLALGTPWKVKKLPLLTIFSSYTVTFPFLQRLWTAITTGPPVPKFLGIIVVFFGNVPTQGHATFVADGRQTAQDRGFGLVDAHQFSSSTSTVTGRSFLVGLTFHHSQASRLDVNSGEVMQPFEHRTENIAYGLLS